MMEASPCRYCGKDTPMLGVCSNCQEVAIRIRDMPYDVLVRIFEFERAYDLTLLHEPLEDY